MQKIINLLNSRLILFFLLVILCTFSDGKGRERPEDEAPNGLKEGIVLVRQGKFRDAIDKLNAYHKVNSNDDNGTAWLGFVNMRLKNYSEAIKWFNMAVMTRSNDAGLLNNIGYCYINLKNWNKAIEAYKRIPALLPKEPDPWYNLGNAYYIVKRYDDAEKAYRECVKLDPKFSAAYFNLGRVMEKKNNNPEAVAMFSQASNQMPQEPLFSNVAANMLAKNNQKARADIYASRFNKSKKLLVQNSKL